MKTGAGFLAGGVPGAIAGAAAGVTQVYIAPQFAPTLRGSVGPLPPGSVLEPGSNLGQLAAPVGAVQPGAPSPVGALALGGGLLLLFLL
jgi:hypothetical protein